MDCLEFKLDGIYVTEQTKTSVKKALSLEVSCGILTERGKAGIFVLARVSGISWHLTVNGDVRVAPILNPE